MKECFDIVFVVLVYRNTQDLVDFFKSNQISRSKTIVVCSHYNDDTDTRFSEIARINLADFIVVPNKGYGYGNNKGCEYALSNYDFKYLIISNADIKIEQFDIDVLSKYKDAIIAPNIKNLGGKKQNPNAPYKPSYIQEKIRYELLKGHHSVLIWLIYAYSRLQKEIYYFFRKIHLANNSIYSAHGSFVILTKSALDLLYPLYNERMFLLGEEEHLARQADKYNIKTYYEPNIVILHKEDGSMKLLNKKVFELERQSYIEYFLYWHK